MAASISSPEWVQTQLDAYPTLAAIPDETFFKIRAVADQVNKLVFQNKNFEQNSCTDDLADMGALFPNIGELVMTDCRINGSEIETTYDCVKYFLPGLQKWSLLPKPPLLEHPQEDRNNYSGPKYATYKINQLLAQHPLDKIPEHLRSRVRSLAHEVRVLDFSGRALSRRDLQKIAIWFPNVSTLRVGGCTLGGNPLKNKKTLEKIFHRTLSCDFSQHELIDSVTGQLAHCTLEEKQESLAHKHIQLPARPPHDTSPITGFHGFSQNVMTIVLTYLAEPIGLQFSTADMEGFFPDVEKFLTVYYQELKPWNCNLLRQVSQNFLPLRALYQKPSTQQIETPETRLARVVSSSITWLDLRAMPNGNTSFKWLENLVATYKGVSRILLPELTISRPCIELLQKLPQLDMIDMSLCKKKDLSALPLLPGLENIATRRFYEIFTSLFLQPAEEQLMRRIFHTSVSTAVRQKPGFPLKNRDIRVIATLNKLKKLDLGVVAEDVTSETIEMLGNLEKLEEFSLHECPSVTSKTIQAFANCRLLFLSLFNCPNIDDEAIGTIVEQFSRLLELRIGSTKLTDRSFSLLPRLGALKHLLIGEHDGITLKGWEQLKDCSALEKLVITSEANFNDSMFLACSKIPKLYQLTLVNFAPTPEAQELFQKEKPPEKCRVAFKAVPRVITLSLLNSILATPAIQPPPRYEYPDEDTQDEKRIPFVQGDTKSKK